jgi:hypothetical protein
MFFKRKIWNDGPAFEDFMGREGAPAIARRHLANGGGKGGGGGTTYQSQTTSIPPEVRARYDAVNARAEQVAQQPFTPYTGEFVAPLNPTQASAIQQIGQAGANYAPYQAAATQALTGAAETALPYYGQAGASIGQAQAAGAPYTGLATLAGLAGTQAVNAQPLQISQYMNPYIQSVVAPTMQALYQQQGADQSTLMGQQAMRGAFGGDRGSIASANLARQQELAAGQTQAGLLSGAYQQALQAAQQQQGVGLGAAQANRAAFQQFTPQALAIGTQAFQQPMAAAQAQLGLGQGLLGYGQNVAQGLTGIGQQGTQTGLAAGQALLGAGTLGQQTQQQLDAATYNQFLQQQGYPFQVAQFLANVALGTGPLYGSTTSGTTSVPTPFFSDERVKEDIVEIGRTHDGQKIIKFRYKGEAPGTAHIGLSAQDVEKHHPEAVSETPEGVKAVDYDAATKHAERAYGGAAAEGGAVHPGLAGLGFAMGGVPVPGANPTTEQMKLGLAPRRGFATSGAVTPGIDDQSRAILQQLANPLGGTTPHGSFGTMPGKPGAWSPKLAAPQRSSILGADKSLPPLPAPGKTGLGQAMDTAQGVGSAINTGETLYKGGKKAVDWVRENTKPYSNVGELIEKQGLGSDQSATSAPQTQAAAPAPAPAPGLGGGTQVGEAATGLAPETATAALETAPTEELAGLGEGLDGLGEGMEALSMFAARGGRIHRAGGGRMGYATSGAITTDLPYSEAQGEFVPEQLTETEPTSKLDEPKMQMGQQGKGQAQQKDHAAGALKGAMSGASMGSILGPWGMAGGAILGGLAGGMARGGSADVERGGAADYESVVERGESGGRNVRNTASGAGGHFQFMPQTWAAARRALPHLPADVMSATRDEQREAMNWLTEQNRGSLRGSLGRDPSDAELRYAHHFGPAGAAALLRMEPSTRFADLPSDFWHKLGEKFDTPTLLRQNPHLRDETLGGLLGKYRHDFGGVGALPPAEKYLAQTPRRAGLAPRDAAEERPREGLEAAAMEDVPEVDTAEFRPLELSKRFATGGIAGRLHYQDAGAVPQVIDPDRVDPNDPDQVRILQQQQQRAMETPTTPAPAPKPTGLVTPPANDPNRITSTPLPPLSPGVAPTEQPKERDFFDRAGDWYERNQNWLLPAVSGIGKMLSSPSPYLGVAIGQGLAEAAPTMLAANFKQQGLDINMMDRLGKQVGILASDIALRGGPGMSPDLDRAQQAAMARYYRLSGVNYTPTLMDPAKVREQLASSPFAKLRFADNPDLLYRAAQMTPGLPPEQKQQLLKQASEAAARLADQGFGLGENGQPIYFPNLNEALRNSLYGKAVASTSGSTAGAGVPGGAQFLMNLQKNIDQAQQDYERLMGINNNNAQHPDVLEAQRKVQELRREYTKALSPTVGRAHGGRAGYATDGVVDDLTEAQLMEDNVQLAQATPAPTVPTMPNMPRPPSQAPASPPPQPTPLPSPEGMPGGAPKTAADYRKLYQTTLGLVPQTTSEMYIRRADELEREAVSSGRQSTGTGVGVAPGAVQTKAALDNATYNTKWLQDESNRQQERNSAQLGLDVLSDALAHVNTNPLAPFSTKVSEYARALGFNVGTASERAAAVQEIAKQVAQQSQFAGTDLARNMSQEGSVEAIKNPKANRAIMAQAYAKLDHDRAKYDYFVNKLSDPEKRSMDPAVLQQQFEKEFPREKFYEQRFNEMALPGATPLTESGKFDWPALKTGARYYLSPDEWWRMSGGERIDRPKYVRVIERDGKRHVVEE